MRVFYLYSKIQRRAKVYQSSAAIATGENYLLWGADLIKEFGVEPSNNLSNVAQPGTQLKRIGRQFNRLWSKLGGCGGD